MFGAECVAAARCATAGVTSARNSSAVPSRTMARNFTTESSAVRVLCSGAGVNSASSSLRAVLDEPRFQVEAGQGLGGEDGGGAQPLDDAARLEDGVELQAAGRNKAVGLKVPDDGAVGANDRSGVAQPVLQRVQPARRAAGDEDQLDAGFAARVERADGPVTDFAVVAEDRSVNVTCYQPHTASLRWRPAVSTSPPARSTAVASSAHGIRRTRRRRAALVAFVDAGQARPGQGVRGELRFELRGAGAGVEPGVRDVEGVDRDDVPVRAVAPGRGRPQVAGGAAVVLQLEGAGRQVPAGAIPPRPAGT